MVIKKFTQKPVNHLSGFTLIEVMIVVAIVAILASVALPSYQEHVRKSRRVDAKETLTRMAALQERYFFQNSAYVVLQADIDRLGGALSPEGWYQIALTSPQDGDNDFLITATPAPGSPQAADDECKSFSIDQALRQTALDDADVDNAAECW